MSRPSVRSTGIVFTVAFACACSSVSGGYPPAPIPHATKPTYVDNGLTGYLTATADLGAPPSGFQYGVSFYSEVATLQSQPTKGTQLGWGSWIIPDNRDFNQPLCPVGTVARDNWPERGPSYRDVYQTIEGGVGEWVSEPFATSVPKFRINGTADCYSHQIASTGWEFGPTALPADQLGLAQLSNRLLTPPDGLVLKGGPSSAVLGYGWIALPLIPAYTSPRGVATGDQSWTLFLNTANFSGPVAFYTPEIWSAINASDPTGTGRGHDARPGYNNGAALEIGITPMYTNTASNGRRYAKIPALTFPTDSAGRTALIGDLRYYAKLAIWDAVAAGLENGTAPTDMNASGVVTPTLASPHAGLRLNGGQVSLGSSFGATIIPSSGGSGALGMMWGAGFEAGVIPQYFVQSGSAWTPVPKDQVPTETNLTAQTFDGAPGGAYPSLNTSAQSPWDSAKWAAGPFSVSLSDGSTVEYVWYKFIDQPAIARLGLAPDVLQRLQSFVAAWQAASGVAGVTIAPPTFGTLASLDDALLVTPPAGLESGYVPIVIAQH